MAQFPTSSLVRNPNGDFTYQSTSGFSRIVPKNIVQSELDFYNRNLIENIKSGQELANLEAAMANPTAENIAKLRGESDIDFIQSEIDKRGIEFYTKGWPEWRNNLRRSYEQSLNYFGSTPFTLDTLDKMSPALKRNFAAGIPGPAGFRQAADIAGANYMRKAQGGGGIGEFFRGAAPIAAVGLGAFAAPALLGGAAAGGATGVAAGGATSGGLGSSILASFSAPQALSGALVGGLGGLASGGDLSSALKGAALGGLGGGFGSSIGRGLGLGQVGQQALTGGLTGAAGGLATGDMRNALIGAGLGSVGGYLKSGGDVPFLGSMQQQLPSDVFGPARQGTGLLGKLSGTANTGLTIGGQPMRLGSLLSAGGDIYGYMQGQSDMDDIQELLERQSAAAQEQFQPYAQAGQTALANMQAPSMEALQNDPGYQFRLQQGQQALERSLAARGLGQSGAALKAAQEYGQGLADQTYNDFFNRQGQLAGMGQSAASGLGSLALMQGTNMAQLERERSNQRNQLLSNLLGSGNVSGSLSGLGSLLAGYSGRTPFGDFYNGSRINWN